MQNVKFTCPHCRQPLEAPIDMGGEALDCPTCNKQLLIPRLQRSAPSRTVKIVRPTPRKAHRDLKPAAGEKIKIKRLVKLRVTQAGKEAIPD
jgi:hypothetical protein